jgi:CheY-like chemotaxis protein
MPGKILVVDDHAPNRELIREALTDSAYEISEAATASEALERLRRHKTDLVITDIRMPGLSGVELLKRLKKENPDVVAHSSRCLDECRWNVYSKGSYERDKEGARYPGGSGISGSAPYLRSALSRSCSVLEVRGSLAKPIQCAPNPTRRAACRTAVRRDCEPHDYPRP